MQWIYDNQFFILGGAMIAGFSALTWGVVEMRGRFTRVMGGAHASGDLAGDLLRRVARAEAKMEEIEPRLAAAEATAAVSVQKVGFLRFNPFQDMGGDNSFIVALLDHDNNGVIISSLYMREGTRLYAKAVERGNVKLPLSDEEQKVLEQTIQKN